MLPTPAPKTPAIDRSACPSTRGHGTRHHRYVNGCTCPDGLADHNRYTRCYGRGEITSSLVTADIPRRKLRALAVIGYSTKWLADYTGIVRQQLDRIRNGAVSQVQVHVAEILDATYDRLYSRPQRGRPAVLSARHAQQQGWHGPDEWGDIDDPADRTDRAHLRAADTRLTAEDIRFLMSQPGGRHSADEIGRMYGLDGDTVRRRLTRADSVAAHSALTDDQIHALRADYQRDPARWDLAAAARRYGVSKPVVSKLIHGRIRADLGLTDLTALTGAGTTATTPTGGTDRKEDDAA